MDYRKAYGLPERYFLSLGRMVEKKNLATLVSAYARYAQGVAVAGEKLKVKGEEMGGQRTEARGQEAGDRPGGVASYPQAEDSEAVTGDQPRATRDSIPSLVFVGSGELERALQEQARALGLRVVDRTGWKAGDGEQGAGDRRQETGEGREDSREEAQEDGGRVEGQIAETRDQQPATRDKENCGTAFFYGFRQIEENAVFYALAEAFVLPSLYEEWGLVVNEAMACSLPVIVSRTAGCAEDLLPGSGSMEHGAGSMEGGAGSVERGETADGGDAAATKEADVRAARPYLELRSNGFVFEPTSADALATALARVAESEDRRLEMGKRSREIVGRFSCENFARQALRAAEAAQS